MTNPNPDTFIQIGDTGRRSGKRREAVRRLADQLNAGAHVHLVGHRPRHLAPEVRTVEVAGTLAAELVAAARFTAERDLMAAARNVGRFPPGFLRPYGRHEADLWALISPPWTAERARRAL